MNENVFRCLALGHIPETHLADVARFIIGTENPDELKARIESALRCLTHSPKCTAKMLKMLMINDRLKPAVMEAGKFLCFKDADVLRWIKMSDKLRGLTSLEEIQALPLDF